MTRALLCVAQEPDEEPDELSDGVAAGVSDGVAGSVTDGRADGSAERAADGLPAGVPDSSGGVSDHRPAPDLGHWAGPMLASRQVSQPSEVR
jgi:hypothetical protein